MKTLPRLAAFMVLVTVSPPVQASQPPSAYPTSVFGPVQLGPPMFFGRPDEPDTRFGQQLLILNDGQYVIQAFETGAFYGSSPGIGRADFAWRNTANKNYAAVSCANYRCDTLRGPEESANNFFVFDLTGVSGPIHQARLSIGNGPDGVAGGPVRYRLFDVTTPIDDLLADYPVHGQTGNPLAIYNDLITGMRFGETTISAAQNGTQVEIMLDPTAFLSIEAAQGGRWAIGGAAVPEPANWAMLIAGFGLIGAALRVRRQRGAASSLTPHTAFPSLSSRA